MKYLILIPSYNPGRIVLDTVRNTAQYGLPIWVVVDGSNDGSEEWLTLLTNDIENLKIMVLPQNNGKGFAILHGLSLAVEQGFSHVLLIDSDGQHPTQFISEFVQKSKQYPKAMILGNPIFDNTAPKIRIYGRKISNALVRLESLGADIHDCLFGFRIYPAAPLLQVMKSTTWMRRFDFDTESVVRLAWQGVQPININTPVKYPSAIEGGVSHFKYFRDNLLLVSMHLRLMAGVVYRLSQHCKTYIHSILHIKPNNESR